MVRTDEELRAALLHVVECGVDVSFDKAVYSALGALVAAAPFEKMALSDGWHPPDGWHGDLVVRLRDVLRGLVGRDEVLVDSRWFLVVPKGEVTGVDSLLSSARRLEQRASEIPLWKRGSIEFSGGGE